ncbi:nitrogen fixation protein NifM [Marinospirillum alkaliphilum]|uniref:peptidylprolyl isomerase n=1 Tax=Marinospirillum alkaliphilum DSM 21637 TaxID=1122209 RepID=A0A1K1TLC0_9GAMM|nr:nitrogen fixation protein NifM [Marinospirillum alkaliphilum]SFX01164.1 peptidyl-prolyl cis-trans isomerase C [Marinospirillum alkaliphilum DSM 21637]
MLQLTEAQALAYLGLKIADARYGKQLNELEGKELQEVMAQAERQYRLEEKVLAAPESQQVHLPEATLEDAWLRIRGRYETEQEFEQALALVQLTPKSYRLALSRELRIEAVLEKVASRAEPVSDEAVARFYHQYPDKFTIPEKRRTRHLLITVDENRADAGELLVLQQMEAIRARLLKRPELFSELTLRHSQCPTAVEGGQLGLVTKGLLFEALDQALFEMQAGDISPPLRSPLGYHILYCEAIIPAENTSLEQARPKILEYLQDKQRQQLQKRWMLQL